MLSKVCAPEWPSVKKGQRITVRVSGRIASSRVVPPELFLSQQVFATGRVIFLLSHDVERSIFIWKFPTKFI